MILAKKGQEFKITISSKGNYFGLTGFKVKVINLATGAVNILNVDATEVIEDIDNPASANVAETALAGTKTIKVDDASPFEDGMTIKDENGNYYYIESIDGNTIKVRQEIPADIPYNSKITQVGNTGIYAVPLTLNEPGKYNVIFSNPKVNLKGIGAFVEVVEATLDDLSLKIENSTNEIRSKIDQLQNVITHNEDNQFEIVG